MRKKALEDHASNEGSAINTAIEFMLCKCCPADEDSLHHAVLSIYFNLRDRLKNSPLALLGTGLVLLLVSIIHLLVTVVPAAWRASVLALRLSGEMILARKVQAAPGSRLRSFAEFFFPRQTFQQVLEPTLRDMFDEYCNALNAHRPWKARWVRIRGYGSFWSAVIAQMPISTMKTVYRIWKAIP